MTTQQKIEEKVASLLFTTGNYVLDRLSSKELEVVFRQALTEVAEVAKTEVLEEVERKIPKNAPHHPDDNMTVRQATNAYNAGLQEVRSLLQTLKPL